jgi:hypothetical protein
MGLSRPIASALALLEHLRSSQAAWSSADRLGNVCDMRATYEINANDYKQLRYENRNTIPLVMEAKCRMLEV